MKILFLCLIAFQLNAQPLLHFFFDDEGYSAEAQQYFDRLATLPATDTLAFFAEFIDGCVTDGTWDKILEMWLFANKTKPNALIGMKGYQDAVESGMTFTVYQAMDGNGTNAYIDTQLDLSTEGNGIFTRNSGSVGIAILENVLETKLDIGAREVGWEIYIASRLLDTHRYGINETGWDNPANTDSRGLWIASRTASNLVTLYLDGVSFDTQANASVAFTSENLQISCWSDAGTRGLFASKKYALAFIGQGFTQTDATNFNARYQTLKTQLGF